MHSFQLKTSGFLLDFLSLLAEVNLREDVDAHHSFTNISVAVFSVHFMFAFFFCFIFNKLNLQIDQTTALLCFAENMPHSALTFLVLLQNMFEFMKTSLFQIK